MWEWSAPSGTRARPLCRAGGQARAGPGAAQRLSIAPHPPAHWAPQSGRGGVYRSCASVAVRWTTPQMHAMPISRTIDLRCQLSATACIDPVAPAVLGLGRAARRWVQGRQRHHVCGLPRQGMARIRPKWRCARQAALRLCDVRSAHRVSEKGDTQSAVTRVPGIGDRRPSQSGPVMVRVGGGSDGQPIENRYSSRALRSLSH